MCIKILFNGVLTPHEFASSSSRYRRIELFLFFVEFVYYKSTQFISNSSLAVMKGTKIMSIIRIINIFTSVLLIALSGLSLAFVVLAAITSLKFFLIFSPVFMIGFGVCMLAAEFKVKWVLKKLPFLKSMLGRGMFNIYLSSVLYYYFDSSDETLLAWVGATSIFLSGCIYIGIHFGCGGKVQKQKEKRSGREEDDQNFRQPLM